MKAEEILKRKRFDADEGNPKLTSKQKDESSRAKEFAGNELYKFVREHGDKPTTYEKFDKYIHEKLRKREHLSSCKKTFFFG